MSRLEVAGLTDAARRPIVAAQEIAQRRGAEEADAADLLAGLLMLDSEARDLLEARGVTGPLNLEPAGPAHVAQVALAEGLLDVLRRARVEATIRRHPAITSCHICAALLRQADAEPIGAVAEALTGIRLDLPGTIEALLTHVDQAPTHGQ